MDRAYTLRKKVKELVSWAEQHCPPSGREREVWDLALLYIKDGEHFLEKEQWMDAALSFDYAYGLIDALLIFKGCKDRQLKSGRGI